jgi:hypothetical protein
MSPMIQGGWHHHLVDRQHGMLCSRSVMACGLGLAGLQTYTHGITKAGCVSEAVMILFSDQQYGSAHQSDGN